MQHARAARCRRRRCRAPVSRRASSTRCTRVPDVPRRSRCGGFGHRRFPAGVAGGLPHRVHDALVPGATTEVARQRFADVLITRVGVVAQERRHRHDEPGRAEPALQAMAVAKRRLHRRQLAVGPGDALDRRDVGAVGLHREHQARAHRRAVDEHRARTAHAVLATEVRPGEAALLAQEVRERRARFDGRVPGLTVDRELHGDVSHRAPPSALRSRRAPPSPRRRACGTRRNRGGPPAPT